MIPRSRINYTIPFTHPLGKLFRWVVAYNLWVYVEIYIYVCHGQQIVDFGVD